MCRLDRVLLTSAMLLAVLAMGVVASYGPCPAPAFADQPDQGERPDNATHASQNGEEAAPAAATSLAKADHAPHGQGIASQNPNGGQQQPPTDWWNVRLTIALIVVGLLQFAAYVAQACLMSDALKASREIGEAGTRAWVLFSRWERAWHVDRPEYGPIALKNFGTGPAFGMVVKTDLVCSAAPSSDPPKVAPDDGADGIGSNAPLGPGVEVATGHEPRTIIPPDAVEDIKAGRRTLYLVGTISYGSIRPGRITDFALQYVPKDGNWIVCRGGNRVT